MERRENPTRAELKEQVRQDLGLERLPDPRYEVPDEHIVPDSRFINFRKLLMLIDPIETAAFEHFLPDGLPIDQSMDSRIFSPTRSRAVIIRTDLPIPTNPQISRALKITEAPTAENHYRWLAAEVSRHVVELGAKAMSPPLIARMNGSKTTPRLLAAVFQISMKEPGKPAATWGLLGKKPREIDPDKDPDKYMVE